MSSSLPRRHTASQKCIFVNLKRKAGMFNMYIFVDIYVFRIWIFSCLHQLCGRIFFFLDVMLLKWNRFLIPQQTKGWFVLRFVLFFSPHGSLNCVWDLAACLWCLKTCRWIECLNAFVFWVNHSAFTFKENAICTVFKIKTFHTLWLWNTVRDF